jgi:F-type H+-transporting ATPase subunit b
VRGKIAALSAALTATLWPLYALAAPAAEHVEPGGEAHGGGIEWITPVFGHSGKLGLLWMLINFAALMWLLEKLLFSKLRARTRDKHDVAKTELMRATEAREKAEATLAEYETRLSGLEAEIAGLMKDARERAEAERERIVAEAHAEAEQIAASARAAADREAESRRRELEAEVVDRAVARAEAIIREQMGMADQRRMVDDFIGGLDQVELARMGGGGAR